MQDLINADEALNERTKPGDIYLFGHSHLQWHARRNGAYFVNPGSCGLPLDADVRPSYTILAIQGDAVDIQERRVDYDRSAVRADIVRLIQGSGSAPWYRLIVQILDHGMDCITGFFHLLSETRSQMGYPEEKNAPYPDAVWNRAFELWALRNPLEGVDD